MDDLELAVLEALTRLWMDIEKRQAFARAIAHEIRECDELRSRRMARECKDAEHGTPPS